MNDQKAGKIAKIKTNDIKKGWQIRFKDGIEGTVLDNKRGDIRCVEVPMIMNPAMTDIGDTYVFDFAFARPSEDAAWIPVELTDAQKRTLQSLRSQGWA